MKSAREEFGPPQSRPEDMAKLLSSQARDQVQGIGNDLKNAGVKQDGQSHLNLVKSDHTAGQAAKKDMNVPQGNRPALSPCDGNMQAKEAGQALRNSGVKGGESHSAAQSFSKPAPTPPAPSQSARRTVAVTTPGGTEGMPSGSLTLAGWEGYAGSNSHLIPGGGPAPVT